MSMTRTEYVMVALQIHEDDFSDKQHEIIQNLYDDYDYDNPPTFEVIYNEGDGYYYLGYVIARTKEYEGFKKPIDIFDTKFFPSDVAHWLRYDLRFIEEDEVCDVKYWAFSHWG